MYKIIIFLYFLILIAYWKNIIHSTLILFDLIYEKNRLKKLNNINSGMYNKQKRKKKFFKFKFYLNSNKYKCDLYI